MWDSLITDPTCVPWIGRWILNHWTTKEVPSLHVIWKFFYTIQDCLLPQLITRIFQITTTLLILPYLLALPDIKDANIISPLLGEWKPSGTSSSVLHSCSSEGRRTCSSSVWTLHGLPCCLSASCPLACSVSCVWSSASFSLFFLTYRYIQGFPI